MLLQFRNFAVNFEDCVRTDFAKVKDDKLCFFEDQNMAQPSTVSGFVILRSMI